MQGVSFHVCCLHCDTLTEVLLPCNVSPACMFLMHLLCACSEREIWIAPYGAKLERSRGCTAPPPSVPQVLLGFVECVPLAKASVLRSTSHGFNALNGRTYVSHRLYCVFFDIEVCSPVHEHCCFDWPVHSQLDSALLSNGCLDFRSATERAELCKECSPC